MLGSIKFQGFTSLLGIQGSANHVCTWSARSASGVDLGNRSATFTVDNQGNLDTLNGAPIANYPPATGVGSDAAASAAYQWKQSHSCQPYTWSGITFGLVSHTSNDGATGVFEYQDVFTAAGGLAVLLAIIAGGIVIAKRGVRAMTEETSGDDDVEYYEGHDGKIYWRIKSNRRGF